MKLQHETRGRPRKESTPNTVMVSTRITTAQEAQLCGMCEVSGLSLAAIVRRMIADSLSQGWTPAKSMAKQGEVA